MSINRRKGEGGEEKGFAFHLPLAGPTLRRAAVVAYLFTPLDVGAEGNAMREAARAWQG